MQRTLTLVRHAKSSWNNENLSDFDRPLNNRGLKDAPEMGHRLADAGFTVEYIISSPAIRAITTASIIAEVIDYDVQQIALNEEIYNASLSHLIRVVSDIDDDIFTVMLVGHNPGFTELCNYLSNSTVDYMPTCSVAQIQFKEQSWSAITDHSGKLLNFDYPKKSRNP